MDYIAAFKCEVELKFKKYDLEHIAILIALRDYFEHNNKETIIHIIKNSKVVFEFATMRKFLADFVEQTKNSPLRPKRNFISRETKEKYKKLVEFVAFYHGIGYPIDRQPAYPETMNCCDIVSKLKPELDVSGNTIKKIIRGKLGLNNKTIEELYHFLYGVEVFKFNGGKTPKTIEELKELDDRVNKLKIGALKVEGGKWFFIKGVHYDK